MKLCAECHELTAEKKGRKVQNHITKEIVWVCSECIRTTPLEQEMAEILVEHPEVGELLNVFKAPEPRVRDHKRYRKFNLEFLEFLKTRI